jgi:UDP-N-acetylmuramate-alanine ligase
MRTTADHGKTSTSSLRAVVPQACGLDPPFTSGGTL